MAKAGAEPVLCRRLRDLQEEMAADGAAPLAVDLIGTRAARAVAEGRTVRLAQASGMAGAGPTQTGWGRRGAFADGMTQGSGIFK